MVIVLVADFVNTTGDAVFDDTLKSALSVGLRQSPYLNVVGDERIRQTLQMMGRSPDERVTRDIGREVCQRNGIKALLSGSIAGLGTQYVITLDAINASNGEILAEEQSQADSKERVLPALGKAAANLRSKLGESLSSVQKFDKSLEEATTPSLDALKAYSIGQEKFIRGDWEGSIPFFKKAIELDPNFALAYARMATAYGNMDEGGLGRTFRDKAFELRDRTTEHEKLYITAHHYDGFSWQKGMEAYELYRRSFPRDPIPVTNLGIFYADRGDFQKCLDYELEAIRIDPEVGVPYGNAADAYAGLGRLDEAEAILQTAISRNLGGAGVHFELGKIAIARGDWAMLEREDALAKQGWPDPLPIFKRDAELAASRGQMRQAREAFRRAIESAGRKKLANNQTEMMLEETEAEAILGYHVPVGERVRQVLQAPTSRHTKYQSAWLLALAGEEQRAKALSEELTREAPDFEPIKFVLVPTIQARAALDHHDPRLAIELLKSAEPYDGRTYVTLFTRASAYLAADRAAEAAEEFRRILKLKPVDPLVIYMPVAQLGLARSLALRNNKDQARTACQDFLALWKDADPDIPILKQAKAEYAKLQ